MKIGKKDKNKLTPKQAVFVKEYLIDLNATQAAIRAGYSKKTAGRIAGELVEKTHIKQLINLEIEKRAKRTELTMDRVVLEYKRLALMDIRRCYDDEGVLLPIHKWDDDSAAAVAGLESEEIYDGVGEERRNIGRLSKVKLSDKRAALHDLMKHLGGFEADNKQKNEGLTEAAKAAFAAMKAKNTSGKSQAFKSLLS